MRSDFVLRTLSPLMPECADSTHWQPAADVYRMPDGWLLKVELAGVRPDELQLLVENEELVVSGRRRDWIVERGRQRHSMEIAYSCFERRFVLSRDLADCRIVTEYRDGMLLIRVFTG